MPEDDFIKLFRTLGPTELAKLSGVSLRGILLRRQRIEKRSGNLIYPESESGIDRQAANHRLDIPGRLHADIEDGIVVVASDAHYWPGIVSTAHRAFVKFCKEYRPKIVVMNGDVFDGATASRHPPIGWEHRPKLVDELNACKDRLGEITVAAGRARRIWTCGNHDSRFEARLAMSASEYAGIDGIHLNDHFTDYESAWSLWINDSVVVKHRWKGGLHAAHNNTVNAGMTMVTGHLHSLKVTPFTDYNGTRFGVDTGTLADPFGPQFNSYMEDGARNWRSGFAVLSFEHGELRWPELVHVLDENTVEFRGKSHTV